MNGKSETERIDLIQKLLAKAERAGSEEEAATFAAKAEDLMVKWMIDDAMLRAAGKMEKELIEKRRFPWKSSYFKADWSLLSGIADAHDCKTLGSQQGKYFVIIGFTSDIDNVISIFTSIVVQAARLARRGLDEDWRNTEMSGMDKYVWRRSFREGFAGRIATRLREQKQATIAEETKTRGTGMELVLVDRKQQVIDFYNGVPKGKARGGRSRYDYDGAAAGRRAGDRADIGNKRVGGRKAIK